MHTPNWHTQAACIGHDPAKWFVDRGGDPEPARLICAGCPVRVDCLIEAVARREVHGMWGGAAGKTLRRLRQAFTARTHATPDVVDGCECGWCTAVTEHTAALHRQRFGDTERFTRVRRRDFDALTHGQAATYNAGCRCDDCCLAKTFTSHTTRRAS